MELAEPGGDLEQIDLGRMVEALLRSCKICLEHFLSGVIFQWNRSRIEDLSIVRLE